MSRPINGEKIDCQGLVPQRIVLLFEDEKRRFKTLASQQGRTMTSILLDLIDNFIYEVESKGAVNVMYKYVGADVIEGADKKQLKVQVFRCENDIFNKFTKYSFALGDKPSMFLRKLVKEYMGEPIAEFTPYMLDEEIKKETAVC